MVMPAEVANSLTPAWFDLAYSFVPIALAALVVVSLVSLVRRWRALGVTEAALWTAFVVFVPALGAIVWFAVGRPAIDRRWETSASGRVIGSSR